VVGSPGVVTVSAGSSKPAVEPQLSPPEAEPVLDLKQVSLDFTQRRGFFSSTSRRVLDGVSIELCRRQTLGIVGRNGCGKSTLLRVMAGILRPTEGSVVIKEQLSTSLLALGLGFRGDLTGRDNAYLSAMLQGSSRASAKEMLDRIRDFAELGEAFERRVSTYSSGMRARLGFATALVNRVDILFIDEILAVGDGSFREKASAALKEQLRGDQTVVLVTHNLKEVETLCDSVVWLDEGRIYRSGTPQSVIPKYRESLSRG